MVVEQLPSVSQTIVIGQLHGDGAFSAAPFVLLELRGRALLVAVESKPKLEGSIGPSNGEVTTEYQLLSDVALGQEFTYSLNTGKGTITIATRFGSASQPSGAPVTISVPVPPDWMGDEVRFSAGDYEQDDASSSKTGGGVVVFYTLHVGTSDGSGSTPAISTPEMAAPVLLPLPVLALIAISYGISRMRTRRRRSAIDLVPQFGTAVDPRGY